MREREREWEKSCSLKEQTTRTKINDASFAISSKIIIILVLFSYLKKRVCVWSLLLLPLPSLSLLFILWIRLGLVARTQTYKVIAFASRCESFFHFSRTHTHTPLKPFVDVYLVCVCTLFSVLSSLNSDFKLHRSALSHLCTQQTHQNQTENTHKKRCDTKVCKHISFVGAKNVGCRHYAWWSNIIFTFCLVGNWFGVSLTHPISYGPTVRCLLFGARDVYALWHTTNTFLCHFSECILFIPFYLWINFNIRFWAVSTLQRLRAVLSLSSLSSVSLHPRVKLTLTLQCHWAQSIRIKMKYCNVFENTNLKMECLLDFRLIQF